MSEFSSTPYLAPTNRVSPTPRTDMETPVQYINRIFLNVLSLAQNFYGVVQSRRQRADLVAAERGSLTLEQIIWTVAIAVVALAIVAIVVAAINGKAGELPL